MWMYSYGAHVRCVCDVMYSYDACVRSMCDADVLLWLWVSAKILACCGLKCIKGFHVYEA